MWPREVEDVLYQHAPVHEAAVVGQPDNYQGESVIAFVSLAPDTTISEDELKAFVKGRLASYKCPRVIHIVAELPKTETGKIRRKKLRDDLARP